LNIKAAVSKASKRNYSILFVLFHGMLNYSLYDPIKHLSCVISVKNNKATFYGTQTKVGSFCYSVNYCSFINAVGLNTEFTLQYNLRNWS
jgi:hypothetical protein